MNNREIALQWWNEFSDTYKGILTSRYIDTTRYPSMLTGNEIERIYNAEVGQIIDNLFREENGYDFETFKMQSKYVQMELLTKYTPTDVQDEYYEMCIKHLLGFQGKK